MTLRNGWFGWIAAGALALAPLPAAAQGFIDMYMGAAWPEKTDVNTHADDPIVDDMIRYNRDVKWDTSPSFGFRGGYWWQEPGFNFIGVGLDASFYRVFEDNGFASLNVWLAPLTPLLMGRIPLLVSERFPGGRIQPYAAVGPSFNLSFADADLSELRDNFSGLATRVDDLESASFDVGLDVRGGVTILFSPHFGIFAEYRYAYLEPKFSDGVHGCDNFGCFETDIDIKPTLRTHHALFGLTFRF
jgi:outer membrane protein with beta-barrel domain